MQIPCREKTTLPVYNKDKRCYNTPYDINAYVEENGSFTSNPDWQYNENFEINEYLIHNNEKGEA